MLSFHPEPSTLDPSAYQLARLCGHLRDTKPLETECTRGVASEPHGLPHAASCNPAACSCGARCKAVIPQDIISSSTNVNIRRLLMLLQHRMASRMPRWARHKAVISQSNITRRKADIGCKLVLLQTTWPPGCRDFNRRDVYSTCSALGVPKGAEHPSTFCIQRRKSAEDSLQPECSEYECLAWRCVEMRLP